MLYSPNTVISPASDEAPTTPTTGTGTTEATPEASPPTGTGTAPATPVSLDAKALLEAINADRVARETRAKDESEATSLKEKLAAAEARLADIEKAKKNRLLDPAGFLRKLGYTDKELALTSEGIMFSLMPDKAPPAHVANLIRAQREQDQADQEAREKAKEEEAQRSSKTAQAAQEKQIEARYQATLKGSVAALKPGTFPATQAWYAEDHDGYAQELFDTARNLAEAAVKAGQIIDVSAPAIAAIVEKKYATRLQRMGVLPGAQAPATTSQNTPGAAARADATKIAAQLAEIAKPTTQAPRLTDREIIDRAAKAAFGIH